MGNTLEVSRCLNLLGMIAFHQGNYDQAAVSYAEGLALSRELRDDYNIATALVNLAEVQHYRGDASGAAQRYREALPLSQKLGDKYTMAFADLGLGRIEQAQGNHSLAYQYLSNSLRLYQDLGDKVSIASCLETIAGIVGSLGDGMKAARLFGAAETLRNTLGAPNSDAYQRERDVHAETACADVGELFFRAAWKEGGALTMEQATEEALAVDILTPGV